MLKVYHTMAVTRRHKVSWILSSPAFWTLKSSWNHHHSGAMSWTTHSTGHIMIIQSFTREYSVYVLILCSIQRAPCQAISSVIHIGVVAPLWLSSQTEIIGSTPCVTIPTTTCNTYVDGQLYLSWRCPVLCGCIVLVYTLRGREIRHVNHPVSVCGREIRHVNHPVSVCGREIRHVNHPVFAANS